MNKNKWLTVLLVFVSALLQLTTAHAEYNAGYTTLQPVEIYSPHDTTALPWWNERDIAIPPVETYQNQPLKAPANKHYRPAQAAVRVQPASYQKSPVRVLRHALNCQNVSALNIPDRCIQRSVHNRRGLEEQIRFLRRHSHTQRVANKWARVSNAALLQTAHELLDWDQGFDSRAFREKFSLRKISSHRNAGNADYTGYFTPVLQVQSYPDQHYRFPIYAAPTGGTRLSRREIDQGALSNRNLEIAWTNDRINLFFAHTQGSAIARYPDGRERYLGYAANNHHSYGKISHILRNKGYIQGSLSNENVRRWLHANPHRIDEVLHKNPRYIFFKLSDHRPKTSTGSPVIPGHTLAVDDNYIPLGAVLLAEIPRVDHFGKRIGSDWRLLFAQDKGNAIKGPGRVDMYTGMGTHAEAITYQITGLHPTYMLLRKPGYNNDNVAGM